MNNNEETKPIVYPEQETPPRPTYSAVIRSVAVGGWLYYHPTEGKPDSGRIDIVVTVDGNGVHAGDYFYNNEDERKAARQAAKNDWRKVVMAVLAGV